MYVFETFPDVDQIGFHLVILLPQKSKCMDCRLLLSQSGDKSFTICTVAIWEKWILPSNENYYLFYTKKSCEGKFNYCVRKFVIEIPFKNFKIKVEFNQDINCLIVIKLAKSLEVSL